MKKLFVILMLLGAGTIIVPNSFAGESKDLQHIYEECGLGGLLFPSWPVGASVSNFTWDFGSTASTSGLTTPDACKGGKAKLAMFIYQSYDSIEKDLAMGDGKYLDMLAALSNKTSTQDAFVQTVRAKFTEAVEKNNYSTLSRVEKAQLIYDIVIPLS